MHVAFQALALLAVVTVQIVGDFALKLGCLQVTSVAPSIGIWFEVLVGTSEGCKVLGPKM